MEAFRKNYTRGSISTKVRVLQDSLEYQNVDMSALYTLSLDFIVNNLWMISNDNLGRELMFFTIRLLGTKGVSESADELWNFFSTIDDTEVRVEIITALGDTAAGKSEIIYGINNWLRDYNNAFKEGKPVDQKLVAEAVTALESSVIRQAFQ